VGTLSVCPADVVWADIGSFASPWSFGCPTIIYHFVRPLVASETLVSVERQARLALSAYDGVLALTCLAW
jgi:hypothetical protein